MNHELIQLTITDLEKCSDSVLERHKDDISLCLRLGSVFKQLINSLNTNYGNVVGEKTSQFEPKPLTKILGKEIEKTKNKKLDLKPLEINEVEVFREKIKLIHDSFLDREITDLLDSLSDIEIRGVAKIAGVENFDKSLVDGIFILEIKKAITAKQELEKKQQEELKKLNSSNSKTQTSKQELEKKPNTFKKQ